ncbi:2-(trimethylamino)ethylphosphonate dioxygenase-like [Apostichopus japonicus]|uniref:2-(trimethylamino)ethylphosphonate dioxygenase-like n=1 Tax=Stichopus japonicus TaxID=307972 RepID=UPI003AB7EB8D
MSITLRQPSPLVDGVSITPNGTILEVKWQDSAPSRYHAYWIRHNCHCTDCMETESWMKRIPARNIPRKLTLGKAEIDNGSLVVTSNEDNHTMRYPLGWLKSVSYSTEDLDEKSTQKDIKYKTGPVQTFEYEEISKSGDIYFDWIQAIENDGLAIVKNVPCEDKKVGEVGELVAPLYQTIWGTVFDVESRDNVTNIGFTELPLEFHQDMPYSESPPGLQLLHCTRLDPSVEGGASVFVDLHHAAEQLQKEYPEHFATLLKVPATFQKIHDEDERPSFIVYQRPHISVNTKGKVNAVFWSIYTEGPLQVPEELVEPYYAAYFKFAELIENSPTKIRFQLKPGDCASFNNRRMGHGRETFKLNGGVRKLQGLYINIDDFKNRVKIEYLKRGNLQNLKRIGDQCGS